MSNLLQYIKMALFFITVLLFIWERVWIYRYNDKFVEGKRCLTPILSLTILEGLITSQMPLLASFMFFFMEIIRVMVLRYFFLKKKGQRFLKHVFMLQYVIPLLESIACITFCTILFYGSSYGTFVSLEIMIVLCMMSLISVLFYGVIWLIKFIMRCVVSLMHKRNRLTGINLEYQLKQPFPLLYLILPYLSIVML